MYLSEETVAKLRILLSEIDAEEAKEDYEDIDEDLCVENASHILDILRKIIM